MQSCVSLLAAVTGQRENYLAYWLDLYFQVRLAYEKEKEPPPLRKEELLPLVREIWEEMLEKQTHEDFIIPGTLRETRATDPSEREPGVAETMTGAPASGNLAEGSQGKKEKTYPNANKAATREKAVIRARLEKLRAQGVTIAQIVKAGGPGLSDGAVLTILENKFVTIEIYRVLNKALEKIEKEMKAKNG